MNKGLLRQACIKCLLGMAAIGAMVFVPAGTFRFWRGWLLMAVIFLPMAPIALVLAAKRPELLAKRLQAKETEPAQKQVILLSVLMSVAGLVLAGLDFRFGWSRLPGWVSGAAAAVLLAGYGLFAEVLRENAYLSRPVEVQQGQKLVDTGLYSLVRHPMYTATLLIYLAVPLICGSLWATAVFLFYPVLLAKRIRNEEQVLKDGLPGYREYTQRVRWKMLPGLW